MFQVEVVEKNKTHILGSKTFSPKSFRVWTDKKKKDRARPARADNIMRRMRFACWITKERIKIHTHSYCWMLIVCPQQQWLLDCASLLYLHRLSHSVLKPSHLSQRLFAIFENGRNYWLIFSPPFFFFVNGSYNRFNTFFCCIWIMDNHVNTDIIHSNFR